MTRRDGGDRLGRVVDHLLGEGSVSEGDAFREEVAWDLELAVEVAETRQLFESMRELEVEPSGRVERAVRRTIQRRLLLRGPRTLSWRERVAVGLRVAAVALITFGVAWVVFAESGLIRHWIDAPRRDGVRALVARIEPMRWPEPRPTGPTQDPELARLLDSAMVPVDAASFVDNLERFAAQPVPSAFVGLLSAENLLAHLRAESQLRFSLEARERMRRATGATDVDVRVAALAAEVAARTAVALQDDGWDTEALAFATRALVASGSSLDRGPHAAVVSACRERMLAELELKDCDGGRRATVLAALGELAVLGDSLSAAVVGVEADRLARETLRARLDGSRPELLRWLTPERQLADAGRLFLIAPAFGTHPGLAFRARLMVATHVGERLEAGTGFEQPALIAAQLYGFGDLIDRADAERRLRLWRTRYLMSSDVVALLHVAWSKYPVRPGWADFQRDLRGLSAVPTPEGILESSALLLVLCTNLAAPGVGGGFDFELL